MPKILFVFGTRPEAIKLVPVVRQLAQTPGEFETRVAVTGQHRELLDQVLDAFSVRPDHDLNVMRPGQSLVESTASILSALDPVLTTERPDLVMVQGDTTSTLCGALAAFDHRIPSAHVEAGLRTGDMGNPFPEEMNRVMTSRLATLHFAPTEGARNHLLREGVDRARVFVTGNTGIDAVLAVRDALERGELHAAPIPDLDSRKRLVVVTAHRRESFGPGFEGIVEGLARLAARPDLQIVYPVHPNPNVREVIERQLRGVANILLVEPIGYVPFVDLMRRSYLLLTDSGGIQEEGPSLGKPVLVMRKATERPEAVEAGTARLVGTDPDRIVAETELLLEDAEEYRTRSRMHNPYGDGRASIHIRDILHSHFSNKALSRPAR